MIVVQDSPELNADYAATCARIAELQRRYYLQHKRPTADRVRRLAAKLKTRHAIWHRSRVVRRPAERGECLRTLVVSGHDGIELLTLYIPAGYSVSDMEQRLRREVAENGRQVVGVLDGRQDLMAFLSRRGQA